MYCDNCGNQLRDGAKFCNKCGMQIAGETVSSDVVDKRENVSNDQTPSTSHSQSPETGQKIQNEKSPANPPKNKKRIITISAITAILLVVIIIVVSAISRADNSKTISSSFSIPHAFVVEEKSTDGSSYGLLSATANSVINHNFYSGYQSSDNGMFAFASKEGGKDYIFVYDIDGNSVLQKQTCKEKFLLSGNGKTLAYYYEIDGKNLITRSSDISVMMNNNGDKKYPVLSASSDGEKACFISSEGIAYLVTPETISDPVKVLEGAKVPVFSSDDQLYIRKGTVSGNIYDPGDLYKITDDNQASFQYSDVIFVLPIKSGLFLYTNYSDETYTYTVLKEENGNYSIVTNDASDHLTLLW